MGSVRATRRRVVAVGVVVVALAAVAGGRAEAGSVYVHSATSGKFAGGRLTLHGIGHDVTWVTSSGDTGVTPITLVQQRLFAHGGSATGCWTYRAGAAAESSRFASAACAIARHATPSATAPRV